MTLGCLNLTGQSTDQSGQLIYDSSELRVNVEIFRIDASTSPDVVFPDPEVSNQLSIVTGNLNLVEKQDYYVLLDDGIAVGQEFCGPESARVWDPFFWNITIRDVTPPRISFHNPPDVSPINTTFSWEFDEESTTVCALQDPLSTGPIDCPNNTFTRIGMAEGYHTLYVQASDVEGNSKQYQQQWFVDLTPPLTTFSRVPGNFSRESEFTFQFYCTDYTTCTFNCKMDTDQYTVCSSPYTVQNLNEALHTFTVMAIDSVGNIGAAVAYSWNVDNQAPAISGLANATVSCGDPITPTLLGIPTVTDVLDPDPTVTYEDVATSQCITLRHWTATDMAGNSRTITQYISFSNQLPGKIFGQSLLYIACGSVETLYDIDYILTHQFVTVIHPCDREVSVTYMDSAPIDDCGIDITRQWTATDDCGGVANFPQTIRILRQRDPDEPENGQINVNLDQPLRWPAYPEATEYRVYIWRYGEAEPLDPVGYTTSLVYYPENPFPPNTEILWRIGYVIENGTQEVPSPVWGLTTKAFADLEATALDVPSVAFSGTAMTIQYSVENVGNISTSASSQTWYDRIYIGLSGDVGDARLDKSIRQTRYVDPLDGFLTETDVDLMETEIGNFYIFVIVDVHTSVDDFSRDNNFLKSTTPVKVRLRLRLNHYRANCLTILLPLLFIKL